MELIPLRTRREGEGYTGNVGGLRQGKGVSGWQEEGSRRKG